MTTHELAFTVRWGEVDPAGILFYPRFFEWFDRGTEALFAALDLAWPTLFPREGIVGVPIIETGARFLVPVRYGDGVRLRSTVATVTDKTFRVEHEVRVDATACATGFEVRAWVGAPATPGGRLHARAIPAAIAARLKGEPPP